jgi:hypothetical protein
MRTNIQDDHGRVIGWTMEDAHTIRIYNRSGRCLGYYVKHSDATHRQTPHRFFGRGNQLLRLLE